MTLLLLTDQRGPNVRQSEIVLMPDGMYRKYVLLNWVEPIEYIPIRIVITPLGVGFKEMINEASQGVDTA